MVGSKELWLHCQAYGLLAAIVGAVVFVLWRLYRPARLLPLVGERPARWTGQEVVLVCVLYLLVVPCVLGLLDNLGFFQAVYDTAPSVQRKQPWVWVFTTPLFLATTVTMLYALTRTRPAQYGITPVRTVPNLAAGFFAWLVLAPIVLALYFLVVQIMPREQHVLERLAQDETLLPIEWVLWVFMAVVAAPLVEEVLFRGVLLGWLRGATLKGHVAVALAGLMRGFLAMIEPLLSGQGSFWDSKWEPFAFALILTPIYLVPVIVWERVRSEERAGALQDGRHNGEAVAAASTGSIALGPLPAPFVRLRAFFLRTPGRRRALAAWGPVCGSAMLFATFHSVWPSPIPLFVLAIGLGWLAYRTRSLVGPIFAHALFNSIACVVQVLGRLY